MYVKLVPRFSEDEVGKYFISFEKVARPQEHWTIMLQVVLTGKAHVAYSTLSADESAAYEEVKKAVLQAYELVPEAYRQKFRKLRKEGRQTYVELARKKEKLFEDWYKSKDIVDFDGLRELILFEEIKNFLPKEIKTHLEGGQVEFLEVAAKMSDEYVLTHKYASKFDFRKPDSLQHKGRPDRRGVNGNNCDNGNERQKK